MSYHNANALKAEFICPFNAYHKQQDARKLSFHIGRCGDRKGKVVYKCQYNNSHILIDARQLIMHEQNCELKVKQENRSDSGQQILDPSLPEDMRKLIDQASVRAPFCAYCKFNVAHCFKSILERDSHEETCPDRNLYEINAQKTHQIFSRNKNWIVQAQLQKKTKNQQQIELGLSINTPESRAMPNLTYKYCMNEPFVNGTSAQIQSSHEQFAFKIHKIFENPNGDPIAVKPKTEDEIKLEQEELWNHVNMTANEDITKMIIKQDCQEIFELDIIFRKSFQNNLFEFNIEEYITVEQFREITSVDFEDLEKTREFIRENSIFQMNVLQTENSKGSMMFGLQMLDQMKSRVMNPEDDDRFSTIIGLNSNQGDHICGLPEEEQDTTKTLLFFFSRHTPKISQYLSDCDFTIIMFQQQIKPSSSLPNIKQEISNYFESTSDFQNLPQQQSFDLQSLDESGLKRACQEAQKVNQDLKVYVEDLMRKQSDGEKILYDRERTIRDQKSKNTYLEQENRRLRARAKELEESFAASESRNKDMDKDKEQIELQLKIMSKKFEVEKQKADSMGSKINEKELEIARCKDILNQANKQMKQKDADYAQLKERLEKTESLFKEAASISGNSKAIGQIEQQKITELIMQAVGITSGDFIPTQKANNQVLVENQNQEMMMQVDSQEKDQPHASNQDLDEDEGEILDDEPDMAKVQKLKLQMKAKQLLKQSNCTEDKSLNPETNLGQSSLLSTFNNKDFEDSKISKPQNFKYSSLFEQSNIKVIDDSKVTPANNNMISTPQTAITKQQLPNSSATLDSSSIPDEMLCVGCMDKRKEVMIVSCRHLVYCKPCEDHYNLRHADYKECPICRKEYKKTLQIFYT